ncbi:MAG: hypothetical protein AAF573_15410, partial [Bacteroidota bacterium]
QLTPEAIKKILSPHVSFTDKIKLLPKGTRRRAQNHLTATISAIKVFQKKEVGLTRPDGRVDPDRQSLRILNEKIDLLPPPIPSSFDQDTPADRINVDDVDQVVLLDGKIEINLNGGNKSKKKVIDTTASRAYILNNYNWSGIVKLMRFAFENNKNEYPLPNHLTGTTADDEVIIPDLGIQYIIQLQLDHQLKLTPPTSRNLDAILKKVDGKPGPGFLSQIVGVVQAVFLNENNNRSFIYIFTKTKISIPSISDSEDILYDFFRKIVHARNGLWSDNQGVVNIVGLRRVLDKMAGTAYNDGIAVCWLDHQSGAKKVELSIATTEPGNRFRNRQVTPQTLTMVPGYHKGRQPAGRTRDVLIQSGNNGRFKFEKGDTTFNFHQGGNKLKVPGNHWLSNHGLGGLAMHGFPSRRFSEEQLFGMNLTLSEIYLLLSQYGGRGVIPPYQRMQKLAEAKPIKINKVKNGVATVTKAGVAKKRNITLSEVKKWMVNYWYHNRLLPKSKVKIFTIIQKLSSWDEDRTKELEKLNKQQILAEITDDFILNIIKKQIEYFPELKDIDGKAGPIFYRVIEGLRPSKAQAKKDFKKMNNLLRTLEKFPFTRMKRLQHQLKNTMQINTDLYREHLKLHVRYDDVIEANIIENATVGTYSAGCQVIYDNEVFYEFWTKLLHRAQQSGQRRWYYTLIDATGWKKTDVI